MEEATRCTAEAMPAVRTPDEARKAFDAMPVSQIAVLWRALQGVSLRDKTDGTRATFHYFDSLPHEQPDRALDLVLEVLRTETDMPTRLQMGDKFVPALMSRHGEALLGRLEQEAAGNAPLRWMLGSVYHWTEDEALQARFEAIADAGGWRESREAHEKRDPAIRFERLSAAELARAWIVQSGLPDKDRGENWMRLQDYGRDLRDEDPERALQMVLEVLRIETNPNMLSYLAAGPLEELIGPDTIERIEREAAANPQFRSLLGGVWYASAPEELKARLDAIVAGRRG